MFSRAVRWPVLRRRATAFGPVVLERVVEVEHLREVGADRAGGFLV